MSAEVVGQILGYVHGSAENARAVIERMELQDLGTES